jgi:leader peptidase (prepilin peptidase)/N-methyltransferase
MDGTLTDWFSTWLFGGFFLALGLCVGSFLNVCIYRLPAGKSLVWPGSHCTSCDTPIAWYDNIPVASYFILGGRCRKCGARFSVRYMLVELATGLIWFGYWFAYFRTGLRGGADNVGVYLVHVALASALLASGVIDYERKEIYTSVTNFALAVGLAASIAWPEVQQVGAYDRLLPAWTGWERIDAVVLGLVGAAVGAGIINLTRFLGTLAFRREAMGIGDVYLMAAIGGCLGWEAAVLVFLVAPFLGLPYGVWQVLRARKQPQEESGEEPAPPAPKTCFGTFMATVAGFVLFAVAAATARPEWGAAQRLMLVAGLTAFGVSFLFLRKEEEQAVPLDDAPSAESGPPETDAREVPYGPFLGAAAALVMLVQNYAVAYFQPGVQALWHAVAG